MYAELHCLSNFSFLRSASHPAELVTRAAELGYSAIAITDECSFAGIVKAHVAARSAGIKLIIGAEFRLREDTTVVVLVTNKAAYSELSALITVARRRSEKGKYEASLDDLEKHLRRCLIIWVPDHREPLADTIASRIRHVFAGRLWVGFSHLLTGDQYEQYDFIYQLAVDFQIPMVACGNVVAHLRSRKRLLDVLTAIHFKTSIEELGYRRGSNEQRCLRPLSMLQKLYPPELLVVSVHIANRCTFTLDEIRYEYPPEVVPVNQTPATYLRSLVQDGAHKRWPKGVRADIQQQIEKELELIAELEYEYYFLTVHDIVSFARSQKILCQGRGSAANSVVCYCLYITEVSPENSSLLFERFISKERNEPPDIDVDFEHERREEVIQYIYRKYGRERAALAATVVYYRPKSAVRDVGRALGLDQQFVEKLSKSLAWWDRREELLGRFEEQGFGTNSYIGRLFFELMPQLLGFPRHLSQHVGGFIITASPISTLVPVENASMPDRTVIQWDKEDIEAMGLLKIDILALGMLTAIRRCLDLIPQHHAALRVEDIPQDDGPTYTMLQAADTVGVFQVESRAQMAMLPRLKPAKFYDLVIEVALVRPGPIQGDMVHPYLRRRQGLEPVSYPNAEIEAVLGRTLGVPIFQEQVIKLAMVAANFTPGEADQLRRAMASWGKNGRLLEFREKLINGMLANGHPMDFAERLFEQMKGFGAYGFPESHSASFALLVYISAYLKCHYPAAFACALLNSQPMGFYSPSQIVQDLERHNIEIRALDIRYSRWDHTLESTNKKEHPALRLGLCLAKSVQKAAIDALLAERDRTPFTDLIDLKTRGLLSTAQMSHLISAGALHGLSGHRYQSFWQALAIHDASPLPIQHQDLNDSIELLAPTEMQNMAADYGHTGLTLGRHPMTLLREKFELFRRCTRYSDLKSLSHGRFVRVAGIVTGRQRPGTASGVLFLTLEDETGNINVVVWESLQQRCRQALLKANVLMVKGTVETDNNVVHVIGGDLIDCSKYLSDVELTSRDFH